MRLILHMGMAKTGTTSLQEALHAKTRELAAHGVVYPVPGRSRRSHALLSAPMFERERMPRSFIRGGRSPEEMVRRGERAWKRLAGQLRRSDASTAVISSEYFFALKAPGIEQLRDRFASMFEETEVVLYVRSPVDHYVSSIQQRIKGSHVITPPADFQMRLGARTRRLAEIFDGRVTVRPFDRSQLIAGDITTDFATRFLGEDVAVEFGVAAAAANTSISAEAMCVLQDFRREVWADSDNRITKASTRLVDSLADLPAQVPATRPTLRPLLAAGIVAKHQAELKVLRRRFGVTFSDLPDPRMPDPELSPEWESGELRDILVVDGDSIEATRHAMARLLDEARASAG
jgi:hypothetical protein